MAEKLSVEQRSMNLFHKCAQEFKTEADLALYAGVMAALSHALLRGVEGNEFVEGFLKSALADENPLVISPKARH